jgi:hypothetical protein
MQLSTQQTPALAPVPMVTPVAANRYATVEQTAQLRPAFTRPALRDIRFKSANRINSRGEVIKGNGSADFGVWVSIGRKVLIDLDAFDRWIESHKMGGDEK